MSRVSHIHVRRLEVNDFKFVQDLASQQSHFTVPPNYVLWLMLKIKGSICLVAEHSEEGPLGYLLAVPVDDPEDAIFVWQLASSDGPQREKAMRRILTEFRSIILSLEIHRIVFSSVPNSPTYRAIRRYAWRVFSAVPQVVTPLPAFVDTSESEFLLRLSEARRQ